MVPGVTPNGTAPQLGKSIASVWPACCGGTKGTFSYGVATIAILACQQLGNCHGGALSRRRTQNAFPHS
jgi:hypothetical protein